MTALPRKTRSKPQVTPWPAPSPEQCERTVQVLEDLHGAVRRPSKSASTHVANLPVLDALVHTILSQNTTSANSTRAFHSLQQAFGGQWRQVLDAPVEEVSASIRTGGLANIKAKRIQTILQEVQMAHGRLDLEHLRDLSDEEVTAALLRFDGVGPKTASCVLLFCLRRDSFAVDTHVYRIARQQGWIPPKANREQAYHHLDRCVPNALKYRLHVLLIRHGKTCPHCAAHGRPQLPPCGPCPLH